MQKKESVVRYQTRFLFFYSEYIINAEEIRDILLPKHLDKIAIFHRREEKKPTKDQRYPNSIVFIILKVPLDFKLSPTLSDFYVERMYPVISPLYLSFKLYKFELVQLYGKEHFDAEYQKFLASTIENNHDFVPAFSVNHYHFLDFNKKDINSFKNLTINNLDKMTKFEHDLLIQDFTAYCDNLLLQMDITKKTFSLIQNKFPNFFQTDHPIYRLFNFKDLTDRLKNVDEISDAKTDSSNDIKNGDEISNAKTDSSNDINKIINNSVITDEEFEKILLDDEPIRENFEKMYTLNENLLRQKTQNFINKYKINFTQQRSAYRILKIVAMDLGLKSMPKKSDTNKWIESLFNELPELLKQKFNPYIKKK